MQIKHAAMSLAVIGTMFVAGCNVKPQLDFDEASERINEFNPKSVVVLGFVSSMGSDAVTTKANTIFIREFSKSKLFEKVIEPGQVQSAMAQDPRIVDSIANYRVKLFAAGVSDKATAAWIGQKFGVDSIILGDVNQWGTIKAGNTKYIRAGVNFRWVDCKSGEILWKVSHSGQTAVEGSSGLAGLIGAALGEKEPDPSDTFAGVVRTIIAAWPKEVAK